MTTISYVDRALHCTVFAIVGACVYRYTYTVNDKTASCE